MGRFGRDDDFEVLNEKLDVAGRVSLLLPCAEVPVKDESVSDGIDLVAVNEKVGAAFGGGFALASASASEVDATPIELDPPDPGPDIEAADVELNENFFAPDVVEVLPTVDESPGGVDDSEGFGVEAAKENLPVEKEVDDEDAEADPEEANLTAAGFAMSEDDTTGDAFTGIASAMASTNKIKQLSS